jgi:hypothetical protein
VTAELFARAHRTTIEPLVVALRAGHDDAVGGHTVQIDRLIALRVVPHDHALRHVADQRLAGQVIPAPDAEHGSQSRLDRRSQHFELRRTGTRAA